MYICIYTLWKSTFLPNLHIYDVKLLDLGFQQDALLREML